MMLVCPCPKFKIGEIILYKSNLIYQGTIKSAVYHEFIDQWIYTIKESSKNRYKEDEIYKF